MSKMSLPQNIRKKVIRKVRERADSHGYLRQSRSANRTFIESLVSDPDVGGVLRDHMPEPNVQKYIKDSILNRYSKDNRVLKKEIRDFVSDIYGEVHEVEADEHVGLYRTEDDKWIVASHGSYLKWETGLRRIATRVASLKRQPDHLEMLLVVNTVNQIINSGDRKTVEKALECFNVNCVWA